MLDDHERRAWDAIARELSDEGPGRTEVAPPPRRRRHGRRRVGRAILVLVGGALFLLLVSGAASAALALATAGALGWLLWRWWPLLRDDGVPTVPRAPTGAGTAAGAPRRRPGAEWLSRYLQRISEVE